MTTAYNCAHCRHSCPQLLHFVEWLLGQPAGLWLHWPMQCNVLYLYALQLSSPIVFISSLQAASLGGEGGLMEASSTAVV